MSNFSCWSRYVLTGFIDELEDKFVAFESGFEVGGPEVLTCAFGSLDYKLQVTNWVPWYHHSSCPAVDMRPELCSTSLFVFAFLARVMPGTRSAACTGWWHVNKKHSIIILHPSSGKHCHPCRSVVLLHVWNILFINQQIFSPCRWPHPQSPTSSSRAFPLLEHSCWLTLPLPTSKAFSRTHLWESCWTSEDLI